MDPFLNDLKDLSENLLFISESEYPFEVVCYESKKVFDATINTPLGIKPEIQEVDYFFRNLTRTLPEYSKEETETAQKFLWLVAFMKKHLKNVLVYRFGEIRIEAYILGETPDENFAGLRTTLIET